MKGYLEAEEVIVAEGGAVYADLRATRLTVNGLFDGCLWVSDDLSILARGKCLGRVTCKNLAVEAGGVLNADVTYMLRKGPGAVVDTQPRLIDRVLNPAAGPPPPFLEALQGELPDAGRPWRDGERDAGGVIRWTVAGESEDGQ